LISPRPVFLLVDSDTSVRDAFARTLGEKFDLHHHADVSQALGNCDRVTLDLAAISLADGAAQALITRLRETQPQCCIVAIGSIGEAHAMRTALEDGAQDFILRPLPAQAELGLRLDAALARKRTSTEGQLLLSPYSAARTALIKNFDVRYLRGLMQTTRGNISEASRRSGIDRANLRRMLRHHEISPVDFGAVRPPPRS
jgi:DNA-binding NtrC family response regulator